MGLAPWPWVEPPSTAKARVGWRGGRDAVQMP